MAKREKNMDVFFDEKIKNSLSSGTSEHFTSNVMHKISLETQFAEEDKKTFNIARYMVAFISLLIVGIGVWAGILISQQSPGNSTAGKGFFDNLAFNIEIYTYKLLNTIGLSDSPHYLLLAVIIALFSFLLYKADKFIFRKR